MTSRRAVPRALVALSLVSAPVASTAATVDGSRIGAQVEGERLGAGHPLAWAMAALIAVVTGILIFNDDDDESPVSP